MRYKVYIIVQKTSLKHLTSILMYKIDEYEERYKNSTYTYIIISNIDTGKWMSVLAINKIRYDIHNSRGEAIRDVNMHKMYYPEYSY